ncbi:3-phosphoserine/phosphohydroxythreonine transaminase [Ferrimonas balearica]|uniref:3-phosphoserine/phosphohydroxythreonine transaminase n=1 Tax=Ferrimonas balearica TaxID=44012 RepID=UPI001C999C32|nr:3-phosphoserine/phosphohydroxythreonine transaminase [Ferrimonas balearica]MBY5920363.1 3-phosphoserine/phosphohydroxythreonine transaminase [Ferrimonas balearica]MBY5996952.1 3-phosphoserine/phosphohydroxythreonine transaminase [Ferrimonas balearica]
MTIYNFCAGPAMLPTAVMRKAQQEFCDYQGLGVSVMELSHRSSDYMAVAERAEQDLRELMGIPDNYAVLFLHGGARGQFSAIPMNLLGQGKALYLETGQWSVAAAEEAEKYGEIDRLDLRCESQTLDLSRIPDTAGYTYVHYCPNETVDGVAMFEIPEVQAPLVADLSSCILGRELDVSRFALLYAGAQKNIGPAGLTLVIVRRDLLGHADPKCPAILDYTLAAQHDSMYNTPPTFAWYLAGEVFQWLKQQGGVAEMAARNRAKANKLYDFIDGSDFYQNRVAPGHRSEMNVTFQLHDAQLDQRFLAEAEASGLKALKGHRMVGGMRASIYNAMPEAGVDALVRFMDEFARTHAEAGRA